MTNFQAGVSGWIAVILGIIVLAFVLSGCTLIRANAYSELTPEQIRELQKMELDVYSCIVVAGPPPSGKFVYVLVPRLDKKPDIRFGENCSIR